MYNVINFNYSLEPTELIEFEEGMYSFYIDYDKYYFVKIERPLEDIKEIFELTKQNNNYCKFVFNKYQSITTDYLGTLYVLIKMNCPENIEINIQDIISRVDIFTKKDSILNRTNWSELWANKVDYLEYQVSELSTTHKIVRKSFSYYVGLAENAIEYFNLLDTKNLDTIISHKRIKFPFTNKNFNNPLDIVLDYRPRDIASYFKTKFFEEGSPIEEVKFLARKNVLSPLEYNLLFCRLLYPSYYFDDLSSVLEKGEDDDILLKYISKTKEYETFLNDVYQILKEKSSMLKIEWLIKKS
ncbi:MAG: hypothetical protein HFG33_00860 [Bacilli bacterium]|nr:hypothetical protein [Bacilli bacterium]